MQTVTVGNVQITPVLDAAVLMNPLTFIPGHGEEVAREFAHQADERGLLPMAITTYLVRSEGKTLLVDSGLGARKRPGFPGGHLDDALAAAGVRPEDVDIVLNTHLHIDHVGWNTHRVDGEWAPTFPNARYLMPDADYRYFGPDGSGFTEGSRTIFSDSIVPVADQTELFAGDHRLSESLWLRPAAGHTPGSSVVWLDAGAPAVFVGDLTHCPIQIPRPGDPCAFDVDADAAAVTRKRIFTEASRRRATVVPAHYPGHGGASLVARGDRFAVDEWLDLDPI